MPAPTAKQILTRLKKLGTAQNRKIYARHGFGGDDRVYGVSWANLHKLRKELKTNHALAGALWKSGMAEARVLAMMIADPEQITAAEVDGWMKDADSYAVTDELVGVVGKSRFAESRRKKWLASKKEWTARAGWHLVSALARSSDDIPNRVFEDYLKQIEREVDGAKNRTREAMNYALINIGIRNPALHKKAIAVSKRMGPIEIDHGETGCKTPDPIPYMAKAIDHAKKKAARAAKKKKSA